MPISVKVTNLASGSFSYFQAQNISVTGLFLKSDEPLSKGALLHLRFSLPERDEIETKAVVVRVQQAEPSDDIPSGMGIKFTELSDPARQAIEAFIEMRT